MTLKITNPPTKPTSKSKINSKQYQWRFPSIINRNHHMFQRKRSLMIFPRTLYSKLKKRKADLTAQEAQGTVKVIS